MFLNHTDLLHIYLYINKYINNTHTLLFYLLYYSSNIWEYQHHSTAQKPLFVIHVSIFSPSCLSKLAL